MDIDNIFIECKKLKENSKWKKVENEISRNQNYFNWIIF